MFETKFWNNLLQLETTCQFSSTWNIILFYITYAFKSPPYIDLMFTSNVTIVSILFSISKWFVIQGFRSRIISTKYICIPRKSMKTYNFHVLIWKMCFIHTWTLAPYMLHHTCFLWNITHKILATLESSQVITNITLSFPHDRVM